MKRILAISLVLALALILLVPSTAMAAKPVAFAANGSLSGIDEGDVKPLGNSGKWLVSDRNIQGEFIDGDLEGAFTLTYGGVFDISDQSGRLNGHLFTESGTFTVTGETQPLVVLDYIVLPDGNGGIIIFPTLCELTVTGHWAGLKDLNANGNFEAWFTFNVDMAGHVDTIFNSSFEMTGTCVDKR